MSIIFGIREAEGQIVEGLQLRQLAGATDRYSLDGTYVKASGRVGMGFQPYHTHQRSNLEAQPAVTARGDMLTFDGRLDNHIELCHALDLQHEQTPDSMIVLEAFQRWGEECFSRFVGDWSLALWSQTERSLYLARDHAGTRTLYYELIDGKVLWSTYLDSFLLEKNERELDEAFVAAYLSSLPIHDLTPYRGISAVSPAHCLIIREDTIARKPHWQWVARGKIRYASETEYDEQFFALFRQSVLRRTGPGARILAELSGGMDSSSIVCMSDYIRKEQGAAPQELIDTISYYDDSEPNWNEKPYFSAVEKERGKRGLHVDTSALNRTFEAPAPDYLWPGAESGTLVAEKQLEHQIGHRQYRVILSGLGGDELLGGPPNPLPELADHLVSLEFRKLIDRAFQWCLAKRMPLLHLLRDTGALVVALYPRSQCAIRKAPPWLTATLRTQALNFRPQELSCCTLGHLPTAIDNGLTWWLILETLPRPSQRVIARREYRYPFLDRDLVDFLLRVPADQLMRPGRRRLLMRRALREIIPIEVLERRRKAYVARGPLLALSENRARLISLVDRSRLSSLGYVDEDVLRSAVSALDGISDPRWQIPLTKTIRFELWLKSFNVKSRFKPSFSSGSRSDKDPRDGQTVVEVT
jgi:asparagine synthase (glutamine-hydrolysing)